MKYQKELTNKLRTDTVYPITVLNAIRLTDDGEGLLSDLLNNKVDKDGAKVLSTNDYTTAEKTKLFGIEAGADVNQNAFSVIKVTGQPDIPAEHEMENLTFVAGSNVTITTNSSNKTISIAATGTLTGATNATDVTIADIEEHYSSGSVEGALQEVAVTKIDKYYPTIIGSTSIESTDQYHSLKVKSTHASAVPTVQLRDGNETGMDIAYDKANASFTINKTVGGAYDSTLLALHSDFITYKGNAVYHAGNASFAPINNPTFTGTVNGITALMVGALPTSGGTVTGTFNLTGNQYITGNLKITGNSQSTEFIQGATGLTLNSTLYGGNYRLPRIYAQTSETAPGTMKDGDILFVYTA